MSETKYELGPIVHVDMVPVGSKFAWVFERFDNGIRNEDQALLIRPVPAVPAPERQTRWFTDSFGVWEMLSEFYGVFYCGSGSAASAYCIEYLSRRDGTREIDEAEARRIIASFKHPDSALQRELDDAKKKLADQDAEMAKLRKEHEAIARFRDRVAEQLNTLRGAIAAIDSV